MLRNVAHYHPPETAGSDCSPITTFMAGYQTSKAVSAELRERQSFRMSGFGSWDPDAPGQFRPVLKPIWFFTILMATMLAAPPNSFSRTGDLGNACWSGVCARGIDGQGLDRRSYGGDVRLVKLAGERWRTTARQRRSPRVFAAGDDRWRRLDASHRSALKISARLYTGT